MYKIISIISQELLDKKNETINHLEEQVRDLQNKLKLKKIFNKRSYKQKTKSVNQDSEKDKLDLERKNAVLRNINSQLNEKNKNLIRICKQLTEQLKIQENKVISLNRQIGQHKASKNQLDSLKKKYYALSDKWMFIFDQNIMMRKELERVKNMGHALDA